MTDFHIDIVRLGKIEKHPNADALDITHVHGGYPCIIKRDSFKEGDLAIYIPVEVTLPDTKEFSFLSASERRRLRAKRLRGVFSMGLIIPVPENVPAIEGTNVAELIGIKKYEPPESKSMGGECESAPTHFEFHTYTDIEPLRRNGNVLAVGEEVILTEKLHGCFAPFTKITMFDGTKKNISSIVEGDIILGVDDFNNVVPNKVLKTWVNKTKEWSTVRVTRKKVNRGNHFCSLTCTPNHQIAVKTNNGIIWKNAENLVPDDTLLIHRSDLTLPELQKQILLGMLLGDASIGGNIDQGWSISWSHVESDIQYIEWIERGLGDIFFSGSRSERKSGYGSTMFTGRTNWMVDIRNIFSSFRCQETNKKIIPNWVAEALTPISLAFWYMDDGSLGYGAGELQDNTVGFATCGFTVNDCEVLVKGLKRFGIDSYITNRDYPRIGLNTVNAEKFFLLIAPYIPLGMQRKLPIRYRGGPGWLPEPGIPQRYTQLVEQKFISFKTNKLAKTVKSYDLTTETHNFFAHEVLVHNSNYRAVHDGTRLWVGSRTQIKRRPEEINHLSPVWWRVANDHDLENKLVKYPGLIFFGEVIGEGVQDMSYGFKKPVLRIFDVFDPQKGRYIDHEEMVRITSELKLELVPHLYRGPWQPENLNSLCEGKTTLGLVHCREGFVIKPVKERWDDRVGRTILKMVGEDYYTRKSA